MKKILLILLTIFTFSFTSGQGNNLQFNNVLTMSFEAVSTADDTKTLTVPDGQVLKITSAHASHSTNNNYGNEQVLRFKEATSCCHTSLTGGFESYGSMSSNNFPVWLKAGTYSFKLENKQNSGTGTAILTGVYFNIVQ